MTTHESMQANEEQVIYANILEKGMLLGLVALFITFALYISGIMKPVVPVSEISKYWNYPVASHEATKDHEAVKGYLDRINENYLNWPHPPTGWSWLKLLGKGDFVNFIGIAFLSGVTVMCYLAIVPTLFRKGDTVYAVLALIEAAVLIGAASGLLAAGGH